MARLRSPATAAVAPRPTRDLTAEFIALMEARALMSDSELETDAEREFLQSRASYFRSPNEWEAKLRAWHRLHPNWPIPLH